MIAEMPTKTARSDRKPLQLSPENHAALREVSLETGIKRSMYDVANSLVAWFCQRDNRLIRVVIANEIEEGMEEVFAKKLDQMAAEVRAGLRTPKGLKNPMKMIQPSADSEEIHAKTSGEAASKATNPQPKKKKP